MIGDLSPQQDQFRPDYIRELDQKLLGDIFDPYFRGTLVDVDKLPDEGPLVLAANHSGNAFPYDGMLMDLLLWRHDGYDPQRKIRTVFEKQLALTWWMRPFGLDNFWRRAGGVDLTFENFDYLLKHRRRVAYFPEGVPGIGKGFNNRYQLQRFSSSFVMLAGKHDATIVPVYIINAEWSIPFSYTFKVVDRFMEKAFKVPFLPIPAAILGVTFPFMWYFSLPVRPIYVFGEPLSARDFLRAQGETDFTAPNIDKARAAAAAIRDLMQAKLDQLVAQYGKKPYDMGSFWRAMPKTPLKFLRLWPWSWPWVFLRYERNRRRPRSFLNLFRDWDILSYYLPLGWLPLWLTRKYRKPPYGLRGLDPREAKEQQGEYLWHLRDDEVAVSEDPQNMSPEIRSAR